VLAAYFDLTPVSVQASIVGTILGYSFLYFIRWIFFRFTGKEGMGLGDVELAAMIGAAIGPIGVWITILLGSTAGTLFMGSQNLFNQKQLKQVPFGPFLAIAAITFCLFKTFFIKLIL
jgi:leader peptidase (prepilin peptidase)/N-methyltransferase